MRGNLHHHICHIFLLHLAEQRLQFLGFGSGSFCFQNLITDTVFNGTNDPHLAVHSIQNGFHQICGGCLPICTCYTDRVHFSGGVSIKIGRRHRQSDPVIFCHDDGHIFGYIFHCMFTQQCRRTFFHRHRNIFVAVCLESCDADKQAVFFYLTGIVLDLGNFQFRTPLLHFIRNALQKLFQFHLYSLLSSNGFGNTFPQ